MIFELPLSLSQKITIVRLPHERYKINHGESIDFELTPLNHLLVTTFVHTDEIRNNFRVFR